MFIEIVKPQHFGTLDDSIQKANIYLSQKEVYSLLTGDKVSLSVGDCSIIPESIVTIQLKPD